MPLTIRATNITGQPLAEDFEVRSGGLSIGSIYLDRTSTQPHLTWFWAVNGVHAGPTVMHLQGRAPSLEEAKAALRENWNKWLAWAKLAEASPIVVPETTTMALTKMEGATRQTEAAIEAFMRGDLDIAVTLAGAAEGMLHRTGPHMFPFLLNMVAEENRKAWITTINAHRDWLKHATGPEPLILDQWQAANMIVRAATKLEEWTPRMFAFREWYNKEYGEKSD